jgi:hypothetical protein
MGMQQAVWEEQSWQQPQGPQQNGQQQPAQQRGQQHHGKKRSKPGLMMKRTLQQKLIAQLNRQRQLYSKLQQEGAKLRGHESTLLRSVAQQSAMLHTLGTVLGDEVLSDLRDSEHNAAGAWCRPLRPALACRQAVHQHSILPTRRSRSTTQACAVWLITDYCMYNCQAVHVDHP